MKGFFRSTPVKVVATLAGAALLVGLFATTAGAGLLPGGPEGAVPPGESGFRLDEVPGFGPEELLGFGPDGAPGGAPGRGPGPGPACAPSLTDEQKEILERAEGLVDDLAGILVAAGDFAADENWDQVQAELLDYVATLRELEKTLDEFAATVPEGRPLPFRFFLGPITGAAAGQAGDLAAVWQVLPEENRAPVRDAVLAAAQASDHPRFWAGLVRLVHQRVQSDPERLREKLEQALERVQTNLERTRERIRNLEEQIARLDEMIGNCTDPQRLHNLQDRKHLAELELGVCEARVARDEFAIECLEERLAELPPADGR